MRRTLLAGGAVALVTALVAVHGGHLGLTAAWPVLLGAVVGLVADRTAAGRIAAFGTGFAASWIGYALRAGVLPDIPAGRGIAAFAVVGAVTVACALTAGRLPLWAGLAGVAAFAGSYETTFALDPTAFATESVEAATTGLLATAIGIAAACAAVTFREKAPPPVAVRDIGATIPAPRASAEAATEVDAR